MANALPCARECILTFILTPLFQLLIDSYSWRGALLILGGIQFNLCVCGMLLRPLKATRDLTCEVKANEEGLSLELLPNNYLEERRPRCLEAKDLRIPWGSDHITERACLEDPDEIPHLTMTPQDSNNKTGLSTKILRYVDYTLKTNARFMVYSGFGLFAVLGFFAQALFLVPYARGKGIEEYQ